MRIIKKNPVKNPEYVVAVTGLGKCNVEHIDNGILIEDMDSPAAAQAVAILANLGNLSRTDDGSLCIISNSDPESVTTVDEFMEENDYEANDDGPTDQDDVVYDEDAYGPAKASGE
jgi:hypothetical protein